MEDRRKNMPVFKLEGDDGSKTIIDVAPTSKAGSLKYSLKLLLVDLLSSVNRSRDFNNTRADYLRFRVTTLSMLMALLFILWIPLELLMLEKELALDMAANRVGSAILLFIIAYFTKIGRGLKHVQLMLTLLIIVANIFSLIAQQLLVGTSSEGVIFGYSLFPYLYIAILSIFPQTAIEGIRLSTITALFVALTHYLAGTLMTFAALEDFWFLSLLTLVILFSQMEQMQMMLRLYRQGTRDPLTGLFNRRRLMTNIKLATDSVEKLSPKGLIAIMMFDLDYFKKINDNYGHSAGDDVLKGFAGILISELRSTDVVGRYGGEEFVAVLMNTSKEAAEEVAERIRKKCESVLVETCNGHELNFTTSVGVSFYEKGEDISRLLDRADDNLYKAKFEGRNRVVVA